jgi:hypothetical protein
MVIFSNTGDPLERGAAYDNKDWVQPVTDTCDSLCNRWCDWVNSPH